MKTLNHLLLFVLFWLIGSGLAAQDQFHIQDNPEKTPGDIHFRFIGPCKAGGRISDIQVFPGQPDHLLVAASTGGIFKTTDGGKNWIPVFDQAGSTLSIGDMAIAASDPDIIWAGTGEASGEQNPASIGDGVYRSTDRGGSWQHMGLAKTRHIARIRIHPDDPKTVYVAATGSRWGENEERGLYKTTDGGDNWEKILYISANTGISDIALHPDGQIILASAWQQRRNAWAHVRTGPESGLYRSEDGGKTWKLLQVFTDEPMGRIALWMAPSDPSIVYACLESESGGVYRSDDAGETWRLMNTGPSTSYWYGRIYGHPLNPEHIFVMGVHVAESTDGGKSFSRMPAKDVHVDHHILWINPENDQHRVLGNDGGVYVTENAGQDWTFLDNLPIGQYYAISVDQQNPYYVYGGLQDNGVWGGPSEMPGNTGLINDDLRRVCGGDGFYSATDPHNPDIVYGESQYGFIVRRNFSTGSHDLIKPMPDSVSGLIYRFNWNTPFFISVHPPHALYAGGNFVFRSADEGKNWMRISADLSRQQDLSEVTVIGQKPVLKPYASITALAESPLKPGFILAGTDDGNLHITLDDGKNWTDLTDRLPMPQDRFFTRVLWSAQDLGTAWVACGRFYEADDLSPWLFRTSDFGASWERLTTGLPEMAVIRALAEHPDIPGLLFAGSHNALWLSRDGGQSWEKPDWGLPPVAIDDIKLAFPANDLVLGSYGRGIIILDNLSFLRSGSSHR